MKAGEDAGGQSSQSEEVEERDRRERGKRHEGPSLHHTEGTDSIETDISVEEDTGQTQDYSDS